ncbi:MAG TPA: SusC/RagA family TonB-linked outer membrane protein [Balneolaceae bacterium]|nr:SusC/RagA family TonB-linked outer membrane protein [Balneolaceae bacterium]
MAFLFTAIGARAQQVTVNGTVKDSKTGETLPGVNIQVKGTTQGTITNNKGEYKLQVPSSRDTLIFSYVGYKSQSIPVGGRSTINVKLKPTALQGEQMVVTGYLTQSENNVIGSVSHVGSTNLQQSNTTNVASMLEGKAAGTYVSQNSGQPGTNPTILIRGKGSISAGSSPLYVIDGTISNYNNVNPEDIKSITILKGPAATAIYGSRAANGVVEITTKSGSAQSKTNFDVNLTSGVAHALEGNLHFMNGAQFLNYYKAIGQNPPPYADTQANTNWFRLMFRPAVIQKYHVSASSGTKKDQFYVSGNYYQNNGTRIVDHYQRIAGRANYTHIFNSKFTITTRLSGRYVKNAQPTSGHVLFAAYEGVPWDKPYNSNGTLRKGVLGENWVTRDARNPLYDAQYNYNRTRTYHFYINPELSYQFSNYFTLTSNNKVDINNNLNETYLDKRTVYGASTNGSLSNSSGNTDNVETSDLLKYKQSINRNNLNAVLGFEYQKQNVWNFNATGTGIGNFDVLDLAANPYQVGGSKSDYKFMSQFLQFKYNYYHKYFFTGSFRRDGSSRFGSKNRYGNFYAFGGAWMLSNEGFFKKWNPGFINQLKLKLAYGITGNAQIGDYASQSLQNYGLKYMGNPGSYPANLGNEALTWEKQHDWQLGLNAKFFNSRLNVSFDAYKKKDTNLLQGVPLAYSSGFTSQLQNIGAVQNKGLEGTISTVNVQSGGFTWTTSLNITYNHNKVVELYNNKSIIQSVNGTGMQIIDIGSELNTWYMPKWAGVNPQTGDPQWQKIVKGPNGKKKIELTNDYNKATTQKVGSSIPSIYGGITNNIKFKGLSLYAVLNYVGGYKTYSFLSQHGISDGRYVALNQFDLSSYSNHSRWQKPGDHATDPKLVKGGNHGSNNFSTRYLYNGTHLRLQELKLAYTLPVSLTSKMDLNTVQFYADGENLWTHTAPSYIGPDPSEGLNGGENRYTKYPNSRTFMFGINLKF